MQHNLGIIGGTGWMGRGMIRQWLEKKVISPDQLWVSNRSGLKDTVKEWSDIHFTTDNHILLENADIVILSIRPHQLTDLKLNLANKLVISIMAGVSMARIHELTQATHLIRAMPNAAVDIGESYTPWTCNEHISTEQKHIAHTLFSTMGTEDEVKSDDEINFMTALTGSGPGYVAYYMQSLQQAAMQFGIDPTIADHAVRQLFKGASLLYRNEPRSLDAIVDEFVKYAGTTAAGITKQNDLDINDSIISGVMSAYHKASSDMSSG